MCELASFLIHNLQTITGRAHPKIPLPVFIDCSHFVATNGTWIIGIVQIANELSICSVKSVQAAFFGSFPEIKKRTATANPHCALTIFVQEPVSYTHLRAHETPEHLVCRLLLEKKKK